MTCGSKSLNSGKGMEKKNIEKYLLYDNDMMRMIFFSHDTFKSNIRGHISYYSNIIMTICTYVL